MSLCVTPPHRVHRDLPRPPTSLHTDAQDHLRAWFKAVDTDCSGEITVQELQLALFNGNWTNFDVDTCRMLVSIFDTDGSGTISFDEFSGLWKYINDWQNVFRHFDRDRSGLIDGEELANALRTFGYNLSLPILKLVEQKYASLPGDVPKLRGHAPAPSGITFDRFVRACVFVKSITESFQRQDNDRDGWIQMDYETFMRIMLSTP